MSHLSWIVLTICVYFAVMIGIGVWSYRRTSTIDDYMLGGRDLGPFTAALSAGASDMSGWLLMGLPGAVYVSGLVDAWIAVGLTIGAWVNWKVVAPRLRRYTEIAGDSITVPSFLANRLHDRSHVLRILSGLVILVFFTFYVSSGMVAGGKFFESSFGSSYLTGMLVVSAVVVLYTLVGGFLAVSYTDMVQGLMMAVALVAVPAAAIVAVGGPARTVDAVREVDPHHFDLVSGTSAVAVVSALAWGLGYFGQPHIVVRFMALRDAEEATRGRRIGIAWMLLAVGGAVVTALAGVAYVHDEGLRLTDAASGETVFLDLGQALFHPAVAGFMLAAVLAAIMSTISSQLLVCSSALVEDIARVLWRRQPSPAALVWSGRGAVLLVAVVAAVLALHPSETILDLVGFAWAGFGAAFGPLVLLALHWRRLTTPGAVAGLLTGAVVVGLWGEVPVLHDTGLYEIVPGFFSSLLVAVLVSLATRVPEGVAAEFERAVGSGATARTGPAAPAGAAR